MNSFNREQKTNFSNVATELATKAFALIDKCNDVDSAIEQFVSHIGEMLKVDVVAVYEFVEQGEALKCTYEWSSSGKNEHLGIEKRFVEQQRKPMHACYDDNPSGAYIYQKGTDILQTITPVRPDKIKTFFQIPMWSGPIQTGLINFIHYEKNHVWNEMESAVAYSTCRVLSSYLFGMRKVDETRESLQNLIRCDQVTGLLHYDEFLKTVRSSFNPDTESRLAVCSIDFSNFKYINERYSFSKGDEILMLLAQKFYRHFDRILACCREYSDYFIMAVRIHPSETDDSIIERFTEFGKDFTESVREMIQGSNIIINIGLNVLERNDGDVDNGVANANEARKFARGVASNGQVRLALFTREMVEAKHREMELVSKLSTALENEEFVVYYQPKVRLNDMKVYSAEALVRWIDADGKMIFPDEFIPAFEREGCIVKVDYYVYDKVFEYLRWRLDQGFPRVRISMNVSRVHLFGRAFASYIKFLMDKYRIPADMLEFEITESVYIDKLPALEYTVESLRSRGVRVSIDDFGSGYSSLDILTKIPVDIIKLDRVFMKENLSTSDKIIISTIIEMSKKLGLEVVCEGVETEEQLEFLKEAGCDFIQGYYFSKPIDEAAFNKMLESNRAM